jgi:hypothetical protein
MEILLINYCSQSSKYLISKNKLDSKEQAALKFINNYHKRKSLLGRIFLGKKYKLKDIKVQTQEEYFKERISV